MNKSFIAICESVEEGAPVVFYQECVSLQDFEWQVSLKDKEIALLKKRIEFLESDAIISLEKQLEDKRLAAKIVYEWLGKFADHETLGKSWCGWLDDSYGTVYRIWKE